MGIAEKIKDNLLRQVIIAMVRRVNEGHNMDELLKKYNAEGRTVVILIKDLEGGFGMSVHDGKLHIGAIENPTCIVEMDKQTFSAIATGKLDPSQAFLMDRIKIDGSSWLRDSIILTKIFAEVKKQALKKR